MTDNPPAPQSLTDILWHLLTEREHQLPARVTLLENYAFELQEENERLERRIQELLNEIALLKNML
jgi:hypothetical protein